MENLWQAQERPWFQARVGLHKMLEAFSKIPVETKKRKDACGEDTCTLR